VALARRAGPAFVHAVDPPAVDAPAMAAALVRSVDLPAVDDGSLDAVQRWLATHAGALPADTVDALVRAPIWLDAQGRPRHLGALRPGDGSRAVEAFFEASGTRTVAHATTVRLATALRARDQLPESDRRAAVDDLMADPIPSVDRALVAQVLTEAAAHDAPESLAPLCTRPLFEDEGGNRRPLSGWAQPDPEACHRPGPFRAVLRAGPYPLLSAEDGVAFAAFLDAAGPAPATAADLIRHAHGDAGLLRDPTALRGVLQEHGAELHEQDRALVAELPLFRDAAGVFRPARFLCWRAPFLEALGAAPVHALAGHLFHAEDEALARELALPVRTPAEVLAEAVWPHLVEGAPLADQPEPWTTRDTVRALLVLAHSEGMDVRAHPLCVDLAGRLVRGPLEAASEAVRRLAPALGLGDRLADGRWADALPGPVATAVLEPLPARRVTEALRTACPEEAPRGDHPVLRDLEPLYDFLREAGPEIGADAQARAALARAAVLPSQRGTLRAPCTLVLDGTVPDLGLAWGLAHDVPGDTARWLAETYELDRNQRQTLVDHVLDGLDGAARADDAPRASELVRFLARALGAPHTSPEELERRARRSKVRDRMRVPLEHGGWDKPRRAWVAPAEQAARVDAFCLEPPPRIALPHLDAAAANLLVACGARADLPDETVERCLWGEGARAGRAARIALACYVADRALGTPSLKERWQLTQRAWVPDVRGRPQRPADLIWPDDLATSVLGDDAERFPDFELVGHLPDDAAAGLGFRRAQDLSLDEVADLVGTGPATMALLEWLEQGLRTERFQQGDVRRALRDRLRLRDDGGHPRPVHELAREGTRALFGDWRGDFPDAQRVPAACGALGIPSQPDATMIVAFLQQVGSSLDALSDTERTDLVRHVPACLDRLGELVEAGQRVHLPPSAAVAGVRGDATVLARLDDPAVRMLEPAELADSLPDDSLRGTLDPLAPTARDRGTIDLLLSAGVPDLWTGFEPRRIVPGPPRADLDGAAQALGSDLRRVLGDAVGRRATVADSLAVTGTVAPSPGAERFEATVAMDAVVHDGVLWLTPDALDEPWRLAATLAPEPERRGAMERWLKEGTWAEPPKAPPAGGARSHARTEPGAGVLDRLRRWIGGTEARPARRRDTAARAARTPSAGDASRRDPGKGRGGSDDERFFRAQTQVGPQLENSEGWLEGRREQPRFGFAFTPVRLPAPWLYAPKLIATRFDTRGQQWRQAAVERPEPRGDAGMVVLRGRLPEGEALLPIPTYGKVAEVRLDGADGHVVPVPGGGTVLRLDGPADVRLRVTLGRAPDLDTAVARVDGGALESVVPDTDLPDETLAFLADLDDETSPVDRAMAVRDFVRDRYRYDPTYLEDPGVARWLARVTHGRANAHVAALHAGRDDTHLGAGVCYELNTLACELLRRAGIPAAIATGWVFDGGSLSEPDHLWAVALLEDPRGAPVWLPIDASVTRTGRPLRVPRRPSGRFRAPRDARAKAPSSARWPDEGRGSGGGRGGRGGASQRRPPKPKKRRPPRAELLRVLHHLEKTAGRTLSSSERAEVERALADPQAAQRLLDRLVD
jgi:hypothetical protein